MLGVVGVEHCFQKVILRVGEHVEPFGKQFIGTGVVVAFASTYEKIHERQQILGEDGFVAAGNGEDNSKSKKELFNGNRKGIASVDEVIIDPRLRVGDTTSGIQGMLHYLRRLNGDQAHQGRHVRIACGEWKILHVRLYDYK